VKYFARRCIFDKVIKMYERLIAMYIMKNFFIAILAIRELFRKLSISFHILAICTFTIFSNYYSLSIFLYVVVLIKISRRIKQNFEKQVLKIL